MIELLPTFFGSSVISPIGEVVIEGPSNASSTNTIWTCPANVYLVCVVLVGRGGPASFIKWPTGELDGEGQSIDYFIATSGKGGELRYQNNIPVVPGIQYRIYFNQGGATHFGPSSTEKLCKALNGDGTGTGIGEGGGLGGSGRLDSSPGAVNPAYPFSVAGGGAGGYLGNGGNGAQVDAYTATLMDGNAATTGSGGGGGGGRTGVSPRIGGPGGGVGLFGVGTTGAGGTAANTYAGFPGSNGVTVEYGGGQGIKSDTGTTATATATSLGKSGARIIWGDGRSFPYAAEYRAPST